MRNAGQAKNGADGSKGRGIVKRVVRTGRAPEPIGPYSQGIVSGGDELLFTAGQIALPPGGSDLEAGGIEAQTKRALENLRAILEAAGCGPPDVVKTTIFLRDMADYPVVNEIYARVFAAPPFPARSVVEVSNLPKDALVEIEAIALTG